MEIERNKNSSPLGMIVRSNLGGTRNQEKNLLGPKFLKKKKKLHEEISTAVTTARILQLNTSTRYRHFVLFCFAFYLQHRVNVMFA